MSSFQNIHRSAISELTDLPSVSQLDAASLVTRYRHLEGKRAGLVVMSSFPSDPRPRRAAEALVGQGMSVDYICLTDGKSRWRERTNGINVIRIPIVRRRAGKAAYVYEYSAFILASALILAARSLRHRYDLVYINNMPDILVASALLPKMLGAKVILDLHDPMPELMATIFGVNPSSKSIRLIRWLEKWSMARAHQVLTPNIACQRILAARSCALDKITVIMNSPDESIFSFRPVRSRPATKRTAAGPLVVMSHGSLVERNGIDLAVEAFARIRATVPRAQLHIYGKTTPFLDKVMQSARDNGLEQSVLYCGERSLEGIVKAIETCDVGIIPNHRSAFADINTPTRVFEYLAIGKPVIAPRTPGIQDYFTDDSLLFFEAGDADQLAERIEFVAFHPNDALSITERGQQVYNTHLWKREKQTLTNLVAKLLS